MEVTTTMYTMTMKSKKRWTWAWKSKKSSVQISSTTPPPPLKKNRIISKVFFPIHNLLRSQLRMPPRHLPRPRTHHPQQYCLRMASLITRMRRSYSRLALLSDWVLQLQSRNQQRILCKLLKSNNYSNNSKLPHRFRRNNCSWRSYSPRKKTEWMRKSRMDLNQMSTSTIKCGNKNSWAFKRRKHKR